MKSFNVVLLKGDGIGPDVVDQAIKVLAKIENKYDCKFNYQEELLGGIAIDTEGVPLPQKTVEACKKSDAVLLGAVGGPKWDNLAGNLRPEAGLLGIRKALGLFANLRPAMIFAPLKQASPLKDEVLGGELDILVIRELTGGIYFGNRETKNSSAYDTMSYSESEIRRITKTAFEAAMKRNKKVTSVDKANILDSSRLWRKIVEEVAKDYPEVELNHLYVDNAAMQLVVNPKQFDVIVTGNLFGDILSDEASVITGSIGMLPSASIGAKGPGLYEPVHGSAPDIAGKDIANPLATILSVSMMLKYSLLMDQAAADIELAVKKVLDKGYRTKDISFDKDNVVGCSKMGDLVAEQI